MTRGRKPLVEPTMPLNLHLPVPLRTKVDVMLFSELEGRVPKGAHQRFFTQLLTEAFEHRTLDLSPYLNTLPGEAVIRGREGTIEALRSLLEGASK